jgi:hypothetical protein
MVSRSANCRAVYGVRHDLHMGATEAYRACLRDRIGPALREEGFRGTASTWSLSSDRGDWAVVNVQSSSTSSKIEVRFIVNLAIICPAWLRYRGLSIPKVPKESQGVWRDRIHPSPAVPAVGPDRWWSVTDEESARRAADDVVAQLHSVAVPRLRQLLDRDTLIGTVQAGELGIPKGPNYAVRSDSALVVLLADEGRTDAAAKALDELGNRQDEASQVAFQKLRQWLAG